MSTIHINYEQRHEHEAEAVVKTIKLLFTEQTEDGICTFRITREAVNDLVSTLNSMAGVEVRIED
jgi:7-cyano-7-deazaguanine synthase in queuosine biosynthesis